MRGLDLGELPPGYLPLTSSLVADATAAVGLIRTLEPEPATTSTTTTTPTPVPTTVATTNPTTFPVFTPGSGTPSFTPSSSGGFGSGGGGSTVSATTTTTTAPTVETEPSPDATPTSEPDTTTPEEADVIPEAVEPSEGEPVLTPTTDLGINRMAVPGIGSAALLAAYAALEITKRPRRGRPDDDLDEVDPDELAP